MTGWQTLESMRDDGAAVDRAYVQERVSPGRAVAVLPPPPGTALSVGPVKDLSGHLRFVRKQGGQGCWGYSLQAAWDIMNDLACPYSPNLSMNLPLMLFRTRDVWLPRDGGVYTPDGRYLKALNGETALHEVFGCTTEGTEVNNPTLRWTGNWSEEGVNEAGNYRLAKPRLCLARVNSSDFVNWLADDHPIQIEWGGHVVAIVGYDLPQRRFKYVDTLGDNAGENGYFYFTFDQIDRGEAGGDRFLRAFVIEIVPPRPVPAARIHIRHTCRMDYQLWLSVEGCPAPKRRIWPAWEWADESRELHYTVRLPAELVWPPSPANRVLLDVHDTGYRSGSGGEVVEFTAAFGGHVMPCPALAAGPVAFSGCSHLRLSIP